MPSSAQSLTMTPLPWMDAAELENASVREYCASMVLRFNILREDNEVVTTRNK